MSNTCLTSAFKPTFEISRCCVTQTQRCVRLRVRGRDAIQAVCTIRAELRSSSVRNCPKKEFFLHAVSKGLPIRPDNSFREFVNARSFGAGGAPLLFWVDVQPPRPPAAASPCTLYGAGAV